MKTRQALENCQVLRKGMASGTFQQCYQFNPAVINKPSTLYPPTPLRMTTRTY